MNLAQLRLAAGLTQEKVARELGISLSAYRYWERGAVTPMSNKISKLAKLYNVSADVILSLFTDKPAAIPGTELPKGAA